MAERDSNFDHLLASCAVFDTFDQDLLATVLGIEPMVASIVLAMDIVEQVDADRALFRLKPAAVPSLLEQLRTTRAIDELDLHRRAFHYVLALLEAGDTDKSAVFERACLHHLRALRELLLEHIRRGEAAEVVAMFRAVVTKPQPQHAAQIALFDAYDAMRLQDYQRSAAITGALLEDPTLEPAVRAEALIFRGLGALNQSQLERARADFEAAYDVAQAAGNGTMQGLALINQATIQHQFNQFERALATCQHSLTHFRQAADLYNTAFTLYCIGNNALYLGQWEYGLAHLDQAAAIYERAGMTARLAMVDWARGFLNQVLGEDQASEHAFLRVLHVATSPEYDDHLLAADTLMHLGLIYQTQRRLERAEQCFTRAVALAEVLGDGMRRALLLHHYGRLLAEQNKNDEARHMFATAVECIELLRISTRSDEIKIDLLGAAPQVFESTILAELAVGNDTTAFAYVERARARAFLDLVAQRGEIDDHMFVPSVVTLETLQRLLPPDALVLEYFTIGVVPAANAFLAQLSSHNSRLAQHLLSPPSIVLFAVTAAKFEVHHLSLDPNLLVPNADGHTMPRMPLTDRKLAWLYEQLIVPAEHLLAGKRVVHVVPHGPLHSLPFAALRQRNGVSLLQADGPAIVYAPSASVLATCLAQQPITAGVQLALGYDDEGASELALAEHEAQFVGRMLEGQVIVGAAEKSAALFALGPQLRVLHIAGHAVFAANDPMGSFLRLGQNDEVDARTLMERLRLRTAIVVLNACMSGVSRIVADDEFLGLPRAFLYAGAVTIVCTQHAVDDLAAAILMVFFYENLADQLSPAAAMHQAQIALRQLPCDQAQQLVLRLFPGDKQANLPSLELRGEYPFAHQRYWSPFIVIGKP